MNCHCGTPIADHEAGRKLDRCIAEALGWRFSENNHEPEYGFPPDGPNSWSEVSIPHFSESWAACESLVKEMVEAGERIGAWYYPGIKGWSFNIRGEPNFECQATLPHVIALTYLAWKESTDAERG